MERKREWYQPIVDGAKHPEKTAEWAEEFPIEWVECRTGRHHHYFTIKRRKIKGGFMWLQKCRNCPKRRTLWLDRYRRIIDRVNHPYPDGYLAPAGTGRLGEDAMGALRAKEDTLWWEAHPNGNWEEDVDDV